MSDFARLNKGFVNWQGQRLFVPWFGAPRVVPAVGDEVEIVKLKFRSFSVVAAYLVALFVMAVWFADRVVAAVFILGASILLSGVPLIVGIFSVLQRRRFSQWPKYAVSRCARSRFMIDYYRARPIFERMGEVPWAAFSVIWCAGAINWTLSAASDVLDHAELVLLACLILVVEGLLMFLVARYALTVLLALVPRARGLAKLAK